MLYTALDMAATRTQIYLTADQRRKLDELRSREGKSLAQVIREAIDAYLGHRSDTDIEKALEETFGIAPDFSIPSRRELWGSRGSRPPGH